MTNDDSVANCLIELARRKGRNLSIKILTEGLPLAENKLTVSVFHRAALRAGFQSEVIRRSPRGLSQALLPFILIKKDSSAVIVEERQKDFWVIFDPLTQKKSEVSNDAFEQFYSGCSILLRDLGETENRTNKKAWLSSALWQHKALYLWALAASLFINLFSMNSSIFIMTVYDRVLPTSAQATLWALVTIVSVAFTFEMLFKLLRASTLDRITQKVEVVINSRIHEKLMRVSMTHRPKSAGRFASIIRDAETLRDFLTSATLSALIDVPFSLMLLSIIYLIAGNLAFVLLGCALLLLLINLASQPLQKKLIGNTMHENAMRQGRLIEVVNGLETVRSLNAQSHFQYHWEQTSGVLAEASRKSKICSAFTQSMTGLIMNLMTVTIVVTGFYQIKDGNMTMGQMVATIILGGRALAPLVQGIGLLVRFQSVRLAYKNVDEFLTRHEERSPDQTFISSPKIKGDIELDRVAFTYPNQAFRSLDAVKLKIKAGEKIGIIGNVSSGKSTLLKIILGLYKPTEGRIFIDNNEAQQLHPGDLREGFSYIPQDAKLFNGSIRHNLFLANPNMNEIELENALKISGLETLIKNHPMGLDLPVGEGGSQLSGGQRQLVTIAQAVSRTSPIVLMDEPTSSLDSTAEIKFINSMKEFLKGRTLILATHRKKELALVDRLIVMDKGMIIADGPRDKILLQLSKRNPTNA